MKTAGKNKLSFSLFVCLSLFCFLVGLKLKYITAASSDSSFYYYSSGQKISLPISKELIAVRFKPEVTLQQKKIIAEAKEVLGPFSDRQEYQKYKMTFLRLCDRTKEEDVIQTVHILDDISEVEFASPVFHFPNTKLILTDEFCVKFNKYVSEAEINAFNAKNNVEIIKKSKRERYLLRVKYPAGMNTLKTANRYYEDPITIYSLPNFMMILKPTAVTPDDDYFSEQWPLDNTGQTGGEQDADIYAPEGWEISKGSSDIVIAVLDSGVDWNHEDLAANIWSHPIEEVGDKNSDGRPGVKDFDDDGDGLIDEDSEDRQPGDPGYTNDLVDDDDENGYPDDIRGWDFVDKDNDPYPGDNHDMDAHGTACAGLAAAETDNEIGIAGVCWNCKIMPVRVQEASASGSWVTDPSKFAKGIEYASDNGADVLSNSWAYSTHNDHIYEAIQNAKKYGRDGKGCVLACASGNGNSSVIYPAKYEEVIAVGATDHEDNRHYYYIDPQNETGSNYGPELDVVASCGWSGWDGVVMWTTDISGSGGYNAGDEYYGDADGHYYRWYGGTSAATPEVAGLAALILSVNPDLTSDEVQGIIQYTADDQVGDPSEDTKGWDQYYGWGRINTYNAMIKAQDYPANGIVGWWKLNEGTGDITYDSAGDNDGTLGEAPLDPAWLNDQDRGWCLDFDEDDEVKLSPIVALMTDSVTVSAWVKATNLRFVYQDILTQYKGYDGYRLGLDSGKPRFCLDEQQAVAYAGLDIGKWHHLTGTYDGSLLKIYVDGVKEDDCNYGPNQREIYWDAYIGHNMPGFDTSFEGKIDEVRVYNYALNQFEIWDAMSGDLPRFRVNNSSGETVAWFDNYGNLMLKGSKHKDEEWVIPSGTNDEFIVEDSSGPIVYINELGDLYLREGDVVEENTTYTATGDDEFRVQFPSGTDVAIVNANPENGNVYLKGKLYQNPEE